MSTLKFGITKVMLAAWSADVIMAGPGESQEALVVSKQRDIMDLNVRAFQVVVAAKQSFPVAVAKNDSAGKGLGPREGTP